MITPEEQEILDGLPICDLGTITKEEKRMLEKLIRKGKVEKRKWYFNNMAMGQKKTWYYPL